MIPSGVQIFLASTPVDMRLSFERLAGLVREHLGYEPRSGALFVFFGKRRDAAKILFFDGSGMCLFYKRLDRGTFRLPDMPAADASHLELDDASLEALLDGLELQPGDNNEPKKKTSLH
jgi:transposase